MVNFHTRNPDCDPHSLILLDLFLSSNTSVCFIVPFPPLENSDQVVVSVSTEFPSNLKGGAFFIAQFLTILVLNSMVFLIIWKMLHEGYF